MSGIELVAAVVTITVGLGTCVKLTDRLIRKWRKNRKADAEKAQRLNDLLIDEEQTVKREWARVAAVRGAGLAVSDERVKHAILSSKEAIDKLRKELEALSQKSDDDANVNVAALIDLATQSQQLTLDALRRLSSGSQSRLSVLSGDTLVEEANDNKSSDVSPCKQIQLCQAAVLYRAGKSEFGDLTTSQGLPTNQIWTCRACSAQFTHTKLLVRPPHEDHIWINAAGFMKAHCAPNAGRQYWRCIWMEQSEACDVAIPGKRELLKHMLQHHVSGSKNGLETHVDWPSQHDRRSKSRQADSCGYGVSVGGQGMRPSVDGFTLAGGLPNK